MSNRKTNHPRLSVQGLEGRLVCSTMVEVNIITHLPPVQSATAKVTTPAPTPTQQ
ncbi:MAG TPA: hypothetical protein VHR66_20110 [Gemmataceae bacterium]|nr:hypothetical protein [Gemmataceae bacterium]